MLAKFCEFFVEFKPLTKLCEFFVEFRLLVRFCEFLEFKSFSKRSEFCATFKAFEFFVDFKLLIRNCEFSFEFKFKGEVEFKLLSKFGEFCEFFKAKFKLVLEFISKIWELAKSKFPKIRQKQSNRFGTKYLPYYLLPTFFTGTTKFGLEYSHIAPVTPSVVEPGSPPKIILPQNQEDTLCFPVMRSSVAS